MSAGLTALAGTAAGLIVDRDVVRIAGRDSISYLQGQISQDVAALAPGDSAWSLILQPRGRIDAWFRITRMADDEFLADLESGFAEALVARLEYFKLRVALTIEALSGWRMLVIRGPDAGSVAADGVLRATLDWPGYSGVDVIGPEVELPADLTELTPAELELSRIQAGWPRLGREFGAKTIPAETGVVACSVSFTKGCFTGQELVARIDSRGGNVPRPIRRLRVATPQPTQAVEAGTAIMLDGKRVGEISSAAWDPIRELTVALGPVHRKVEPPAAVEVAGFEATVIAAE